MEDSVCLYTHRCLHCHYDQHAVGHFSVGRLTLSGNNQQTMTQWLPVQLLQPAALRQWTKRISTCYAIFHGKGQTLDESKIFSLHEPINVQGSERQASKSWGPILREFLAMQCLIMHSYTKSSYTGKQLVFSNVCITQLHKCIHTNEDS